MSAPMPSSPPPDAAGEAALRAANRRFYDPFWRESTLVEPERFNTWPLVASLLSPGQRRLEVGPGLHPRLPLRGTSFVDLSAPAVAKLRARGARAVAGWLTALPFGAGSFDLVSALDVVEHVDDEDRALAELARVAADGALLLVSVPLHPELWTRFDAVVGHRRRYEPERLRATLARHGFVIERSAPYGMQPASPRLVDLGLWFLEHRRRRALWCWVHLFQPLALAFQSRLALAEGFVVGERVDEVFLVCRRAARRGEAGAREWESGWTAPRSASAEPVPERGLRPHSTH